MAPEETPAPVDMGQAPTDTPSNDKPFDDEPFDAGVEADEATDPKKYIEQLTGKLGQSLRKYTEAQGQPDFALEKFAINSVIAASHTSEMDPSDQKDIINKVKKAGSTDTEPSTDTMNPEDSDVNVDVDMSSDAELDEVIVYENEDLFLSEPKKNNMFQPNSNDSLNEACWTGYKQVGMKDKGGKQVPNCVPINENEGSNESMNYMFWQNLKTIHHATSELLEMNQEQIDEMCANGHAWAVDHISSSADDIEEVYHFFEANIDDESMSYDGDTDAGYNDEYGSVEGVDLYEGKYDDKPLGKPMKGDVKKFKVYVKNEKGNIIKVNFGDPNMEIKRDDPERRKSFRARHKCAQAKDRTTPKYWSCKMWSKKPVSSIVSEDFVESQKSSIFDEKYIRMKLKETFGQDAEPMTAPTINPKVEPMTEPNTKPSPSRKNKPFLPMPNVQPRPKAIGNN
jgi:hypothetical protein